MPKRIDSTVWTAIKSAFLQRNPKPLYKDLAKEFGVSKASIDRRASEENWQSDRESADQGQEIARALSAKKASESYGREVDDLKALKGLIADLYFDAATVEIKSREGCASAVTNLIRAKRELFPPTLPEIVAIAIGQGYGPDEFLQELRNQWDAQLGESPVGSKQNGGQVQQNT